MRRFKATRTSTALLMIGGALLASCTRGGGGSGTSATQGGFQLTKISVLEGSVWEINRQMEFTFNQDVDFSSVSLNTINIQATSGMPASGEFFQKGIDVDNDGIDDYIDPTIVVFQPTCPTLGDLSDAGLQPGGVAYVITVPGISSGSDHTVRSTSGNKLRDGQIRNFTTPSADSAFIDLVSGPPVPVVRAMEFDGAEELNATYVEVGGDANRRVYFEFDEGTQSYGLEEVDLSLGDVGDTDLDGDGDVLAFEVPLNLFSDEATRVAVMLFFNQPVSPEAANISQDLLRLEFLNGNLEWQPIDTRVELVANCTQTGALVRLEPVGILPVASQFRTVVRPGFQDLVKQTNLLTIDNFGVAPTTTVAFSSLTPADDQSDEVLEEFLVGGSSLASFEDAEALAPSPLADWGDGQLTMAFDFAGTGGPQGTFDWVIESGEIFFFDTTATTIVGGPDGIPTSTQNTVNGFVDVNDLWVKDGGTLRVQGPNVMTLNATGHVWIDGTIDVSGFNAKNVATLNTGNQPEKGAAGAAGGGTGGNASWVTNNSTPFGGRGWGAFGLVNGGGAGGISGYSPDTNKHYRRPGGGGGGGMAQSQIHWGSTVLLLYAHSGNDGHSQSTDALLNTKPARGGDPGIGPFLDGDDTNNFYGVFADLDADPQFVRGEAQGILAGAGGGGGGDALPSDKFPTDNWGIGSDEKGGGGGGGAGGINIRALGEIVFGLNGLLKCDGGMGGTGENVLYLDHIGGSGGSGSGGHVVLETAKYIDFTHGGDNVGEGYHEWITAKGGPQVVGDTGWLGDEPTASRGGEGGPGLIQLHVPDPTAPPGTTVADGVYIVVPTTAAFQSRPLHYVTKPGAIPMVPLFGSRSVARSKWISIGGADQDPGGGETLVEFLFHGTDGLDGGKVLATNGVVDELPPLLSEPVTGSSTVAVVGDGATFTIAGTSLLPLINDPGEISNDIYLRTPELLVNFDLRLFESGRKQDFMVTAATYDEGDDATMGDEVLTIMVDPAGGTLQQFLDTAANPVSYSLIPRFFRVTTGGVPDALPNTANVQIFFHATIGDQFGRPDEDWWKTIGDQTAGNEGNIYDIGDLNDLPAGQLQFFRFNVVFEVDDVNSETEKVALDFVRIPFRF